MPILLLIPPHHFKPFIPRDLFRLESPLKSNTFQLVNAISADSTLSQALVVIASVFVTLILGPFAELFVVFVVLGDVAVSMDLGDDNI